MRRVPLLVAIPFLASCACLRVHRRIDQHTGAAGSFTEHLPAATALIPSTSVGEGPSSRHERTRLLSNASTPAPVEGRCTIMEKPVDFAVQIALAIFAFASLVLKRFCEMPRREWLIFGLDTSKQCCGFAMCHFVNMAFSQLLQNESQSPCEWYFVNIVLDTTVRVVICYALFRLSLSLLDRCVVGHEFESGNYGDPVAWRRYFKQLLMWLVIVLASRSLMLPLLYLMPNQLIAAANPILQPLEQHSKHDNGRLELVVVMLVTPTVLNILQLWIQDGFLKARGMLTACWSPSDDSASLANNMHDDAYAYDTKPNAVSSGPFLDVPGVLTEGQGDRQETAVAPQCGDETERILH